MKNLDFKMNILATMIFYVCLVNIIGCKKATPTPAHGVKSEVEGYTLCHTGEVENVYYYDTGTADWFYDVQINFVDGHIARMDRVKSSHLIKNGDYGKLYVKDRYKDRSVSGMQYGDFTWVKSKTKEVKKAKKKPTIKILSGKTKTVERIVEAPELPEPHKWQDADTFPDTYKLVLIKLNNKIVTTGRLDEYDKWQIETDKGRNRSHHYPSFKVMEWKEIN